MWRAVVRNNPENPAEYSHCVYHGLIVTLLVIAGLLVTVSGCGKGEHRPVDLYPEDMCGFCRMAVSDHRCAAEIITLSGEVLKFDDISCMENYRAMNTTVGVAAVFVKNFEDRAWLPLSGAIVAETDIATPMGSGKIAFADSARARAFLREHSPQGLH
jgi:copper chaperone NosL